MATSDEDEFAEFKRWKAEKQLTPPEDETPAVTIAEVLHALVNSAQFPSESTARTYHDAIEQHFGAKDEAPVGATNG